MAHLPIRKRPEQTEPMNLVPMAAVLAVGVLATLWIDGARRAPTEVAHDLKQQVVQEVAPLASHAWHLAATHAAARAATRPLPAARPAARVEDVRGKTFQIDGRAWVVTPMPPITDFSADEIQPHGDVDGWPLVANRVRGVTALNPKAHAYDRLYVDLGGSRYAPLRWRDIPTAHH